MPASERLAPVRGVARALPFPENLAAGVLVCRDGRSYVFSRLRHLYGMWVRAGRPRGIRNVAAEAEEVPG